MAGACSPSRAASGGALAVSGRGPPPSVSTTRADLVVFWFPHETLCPITLYELGAWSMTTKPLVVGVHPEYSRRFDVQVQTRLARPDVPVVASLEAIAHALRERMT